MIVFRNFCFWIAVISFGGFSSSTSAAIQDPDCELLCDFEDNSPANKSPSRLTLISLSGTVPSKDTRLVSLRPAAHDLQFHRFDSGVLATQTDIARWSLLVPMRHADQSDSSETQVPGLLTLGPFDEVPNLVEPLRLTAESTVPTAAIFCLIFAGAGLIGSGFSRRSRIQRSIGLPIEENDDENLLSVGPQTTPSSANQTGMRAPLNSLEKSNQLKKVSSRVYPLNQSEDARLTEPPRMFTNELSSKQNGLAVATR